MRPFLLMNAVTIGANIARDIVPNTCTYINNVLDAMVLLGPAHPNVLAKTPCIHNANVGKNKHTVPMIPHTNYRIEHSELGTRHLSKIMINLPNQILAQPAK